MEKINTTEKRTNNTRPTKKQREAFKKVFKEGLPVSRAMVEVGFSPIVATRPKTLTESKGWKQLMDRYLPDEYLGIKHRELLEKKDTTKVFNEQTREWSEQETNRPETNAVSKALDMAYKLKSKYQDTQKHLHLHIGDEELELANKALQEIED